MKIKSLQLTDFKGFEELHIESFGKQTTAIIGNNGAGKSSIIEALGLIFDYLRASRIKVDSSMINNNSVKQIAHFSTKIDIGSIMIEPVINMTEQLLFIHHLE